MEFANKAYLLLLLLLIPYILWYFLFRKKKEPKLIMSDTRAYEFISHRWRMRIIHLPMILRCLTFVFLVLVLARPMTFTPLKETNVEGINIMLAMDISYSMLAEDVRPNRLSVAKDVAEEFINSRPNDNIGLTIFAGEAFTQCPMTTDHVSLISLLQNVRSNLVANGLIQDGTAIGMGLSNAIGKLKDSKAKSKVIILLTDGSNNMGDISPLTAAQIAKKFGIRVYTIGFGTNGVARYPIYVGGSVQYDQRKGEIDYNTLKEIASTTGGNFYRAESRQALATIYKDIDKLEKSKLQNKLYAQRYDAFQPFALMAYFSLILELLVRLTILKRIP